MLDNRANSLDHLGGDLRDRHEPTENHRDLDAATEAHWEDDNASNSDGRFPPLHMFFFLVSGSYLHYLRCRFRCNRPRL